jgi:two-component system response regulator NreC
MAGQRVAVVLVEDHAIVRQGLAALLADSPHIAVAGQAAAGEPGLALVAELQPDLVLLDLGLPDVDGVELIGRLRSACPRVGVLVLSMYDDGETVDRALRAGARGYVRKGAGIEVLTTAIRQVAAGQAFLDPALSEVVLQGYLGGRPGLDALTEREQEILGLVAEGLTSAEVAERLGLKAKTVQNHRTHLMEKLGLHSTAALVRYALRQGLGRASRRG